MTDIESLRRLTEAVETAGADIAPTYAEYVQLAFAMQQIAEKRDASFSTVCAGCPPSTNVNMPNGYSPMLSLPGMGKYTWVRLSIFRDGQCETL